MFVGLYLKYLNNYNLEHNTGYCEKKKCTLLMG